MITMTEATYPSRDGVHNIYYCVWMPEGEPRGIVQISHGM